jgi:hypothetical protein
VGLSEILALIAKWEASTYIIGLLCSVLGKHYLSIRVFGKGVAKLLVFKASNLAGFLVEGLGEGQSVVGEGVSDVRLHSVIPFWLLGATLF